MLNSELDQEPAPLTLQREAKATLVPSGGAWLTAVSDINNKKARSSFENEHIYLSQH